MPAFVPVSRRNMVRWPAQFAAIVLRAMVAWQAALSRWLRQSFVTSVCLAPGLQCMRHSAGIHCWHERHCLLGMVWLNS